MNEDNKIVEDTKKNVPINRKIWLDVARVLAIIFVVLNHSLNRSFTIYGDKYSEFLQVPVYVTIIKSFLYVLSRMGVPFFLMISGSLLLKRDYEEPGAVKRFMLKNWLPLFIVLEIWLSIYFWFYQLFPDSILKTYNLKVTLYKWLQVIFFCNLFKKLQTGFLWYMYMILLVYLMIPILSISLKKINHKYFYFLMSVVILISFFIPTFNKIVFLFKNEVVIESFAFDSRNLFSHYLIYLLCGYFISEKKLDFLSRTTINICFVISILVLFGYQFVGFSNERGFNLPNSYGDFVLLITSVISFDFIRRVDFKENIIVTYLSKISFGIYLTHVLFVDSVNMLIDSKGINYLASTGILFLGSFIFSNLLVFILAKINFLKKHILIIK